MCLYEMPKEDREFYEKMNDVELLAFVYRGYANMLPKLAQYELCKANKWELPKKPAYKIGSVVIPERTIFYESEWLFELTYVMQQIKMIMGGHTELLETGYMKEYIEELRWAIENQEVTLDELVEEGYMVGDLSNIGDSPLGKEWQENGFNIVRA